MSTLSESLYSAFVAGSPNLRFYPDVLPQNPLLPASVYTVVSIKEEEGVGGNDLGLVNALVQTDTYALTRKQAEATAALAREQLLAATDLQVVTAGGSWFYEDDTRLFRVMREYSVWKTT